MKKVFIVIATIVVLFGGFGLAQARGRYGSVRVGGYTSSGKGSHYVGGYIRSRHYPFCW